MFSVETEIFTFERFVDDNGAAWFIINQDTWYPVENFTEEEARADYLSEEAIQGRYNSTYSAWCD